MPLPPWATAPAPAPRRPAKASAPAADLAAWVAHPGLFHGVREALASAFAWEVMQVMPTGGALRNLLEDPSRSPGNLTPDELLGQSGLTMRLARQVLSPLDWHVIAGYYTKGYRHGPAASVALRRRKLRALASLVRVLHPLSECPYWKVTNREALEWSGYRLSRTRHEEWAAELQVHVKTVARWRMGKADPRYRRKPGIRRLLDTYLLAAEGALVQPFRDARVIE